MASRYYNPRLAQKVGAAEAPMYSSISGAVEKGRIAYERETAKQLQKKQIEMQQRKAEAEAFKKEWDKMDNLMATTYSNLEKIDENKLINAAPQTVQSRVVDLLELSKKNWVEGQRNLMNGTISKSEWVAFIDENVNTPRKQAKEYVELFPKMIQNRVKIKPSVVNSALDLKIENKIIAQEFEFDAENNAIIKDDDGKKIIAKIPFYKLTESTLIPEDTEAFNNITVALNSGMDNAAKSGKSWESAEREINLVVDQLNFTPEQALSIAFDYLGKEKPEYANLKNYQNKDGSINIEGWKNTIDTDGDGIPGEPEDLNIWVKNQLKEVAKNSYYGYKGDYPDKFDKDKNNTSENIAIAGIEDIENALTDFNFSILNGKTINGRKVENTEIKNGKLIINYVARTTSEGQEIAESEPIDLNNQTEIKGLIGEYLKSIYGSDKNVDEAILSLRNKNIKTFKQSAQEKSILFPSPSTKKQLP